MPWLLASGLQIVGRHATQYALTAAFGFLSIAGLVWTLVLRRYPGLRRSKVVPTLMAVNLLVVIPLYQKVWDLGLARHYSGHW